MKTMNNFSKYTAVLLAFFAVMAFAPSFADAQYYDSSYGYSYSRPYGYYATTRPTPVYYPVPQPVYYPQPSPVYYPTYPALTANCYANQTTAYTGTIITWSVNASGGTGNYSYNWSGTDGLSGSGSSVSRRYYGPGVKVASVIVYSGNQTANISCGNSVNILDSYYSSGYPVYQQPIVYQRPVVVQTPTYVQTNPIYALNGNAGLDIGCFADPISVTANQPITWRAEVTGGLAPFTYSWTGSDGLTGTQSTILKYYSTSGDKSAIVSVTSADGKTGMRACSNAVAVRPTTRYVARTIVTEPVAKSPAVDTDRNKPANAQYSAAALFSLSNVPWGWVAVLVILVLFATVLYLLFNRKKI